MIYHQFFLIGKKKSFTNFLLTCSWNCVLGDKLLDAEKKKQRLGKRKERCICIYSLVLIFKKTLRMKNKKKHSMEYNIHI